MSDFICASPRHAHHFFGFHDLIAFNKSDDKLLSLEVDIINRPPLPMENAKVGYIRLTDNRFVQLGHTCAFNYPQGARQQWIDDDLFIVNNRVGETWGADIYDTCSGRKVDSINATCHCLSKDGKYAFGLNYARLHRLGGYGYIGLEDFSGNENMPVDDGIYVTNLESKHTKLLVSIRDAALCDSSSSSQSSSFHHYLTHACLSPDGKRIAFLHRFILPDGGLRTRLMTIGTDGNNLRCLAAGFLSHFDWKDDNTLFIYGRINTAIDKMRNSQILTLPLMPQLVKLGKKMLQMGLKRTMSGNMGFMLISDEDGALPLNAASGVITADGHPMFCPSDRNLIVCDTYPDKERCRDLFLYDFTSGERKNIGRFKMWNEEVDMSLSRSFLSGIDSSILKNVASVGQISFTRSGLHCDLHPRWNYWGTKIAFDSIHEGTRQIYTFDLRQKK